MIYTSYFGNHRRLPKEMKCISIARKTPLGFTGECWEELAPSSDLLSDYKSGKTDKQGYTQRYLKQLDDLADTNPDYFNRFKTDEDIILLCYEKMGDFCHRHILSNYLRTHYDLNVSEYGDTTQGGDMSLPDIFVSPPKKTHTSSVTVNVGTTWFSILTDEVGNLPCGINIAGFISSTLVQREYNPYLNAWKAMYNYTAYNKEEKLAYFPRYVLDNFIQYLGKNTDITYNEVPPVEPIKVKYSMRKTFHLRDDQREIVRFLTSDTGFKPLSARTGQGKACVDSTPVLTPGHKWVPIGDLKEGDIVIARDGTEAKVIGVFPQGKLPVYHVRFGSDRAIRVSGDHLWTVYYSNDPLAKPDVVTTEEIFKNINRKEYYIPAYAGRPPVEGGSTEVPDGALGLIELLKRNSVNRLPQWTWLMNREQINKFICMLDVYLTTPPLYLASGDNNYIRTAHFIGSGIDGIAANYDGELGQDLYDLMLSVGGTFAWTTEPGYAAFKFIPYDPRNASAYRIRISQVWPLEQEEECTCIAIDNPEHLYVTKNYIATHNTVMTIASMCTLGHPTLLVLGLLIDQWYKSIRNFTTLKKDDIFVIQGFESLRNLWEMAKNGFRPKVLIASTRTLVNYAVEPSTPYSDLPPYSKLLETLGIGVLVHDEVHLNFYANTQIDLKSNVKHNIFLSATYARSDPFGKKIFNMVFPPDVVYGGNQDVKYTEVLIISYSLDIPELMTLRFKSFKGYLHAKYEAFLLRNKKFIDRFFDVLRSMIDQFFIAKRSEGQKLLILCQTKKFVLQLERLLHAIYPQLKPTAYFSGDNIYGKAKNLDKLIIISTIKSCSTGIDIKGLKTCINTVSFSSEPQATQCLGRLRQLPNENTIYIDLYNREIPSHCFHIRNRNRAYQPRALSVQEIHV